MDSWLLLLWPSKRLHLHRTEFDPINFPLLIFISALLLQGAWVLHNNYKLAINPYSTSPSTDCKSRCSMDSNCNGYSTDTSNNGCHLSRCDDFNDALYCSSCYFASKSPPSRTVICPLETTTSDDSATTTPGADTSSEPATTPDRGMSTTVSTDVNGVDGHTSSATSRQVQITSNVTCVCVCEDVNITLQESIDKRKKELVMNKKQLSSSIRKLTSAEDSRVSSRNIGVMGILVMTVFGLLSICADIFAVLRYFCRKISKRHQV